MAEKVGSIYYDLDLDDKKFNSKIDKTESRLDKAKRSSQLFMTAIGGIATGLVVAGKKALDSAANFETMGVALKTAFQGDEEAAKAAQKTITDFTARTPFQLDEVMGAFIKLKNLGLDPSEAALQSYGDTASAMGKSLNDMVEAVADAATGEFERLKEFGIRASSEGDRVKFTFQGVTTEVGKNSEEIEAYLMNIGQTKFAGGMEAQSETLTGKISTLKDNIGIAMAQIAEDSGLLDISKDAVARLSEEIGNFMEKVDEAGGFVSWFKDILVENQDKISTVAGAIIGALIPAFIGLAGAIWAAVAPLLPFIVIGALLGIGIQKLAEKMGGFDILLEKTKEILMTVWGVINDNVIPVILWLGEGIVDVLGPALKDMWQSLVDLWNVIKPVLLPVLKFLGIFLGVVLIGIIMIVVGIVWVFINVIRKLADNITNTVNKAKQKWSDLKESFKMSVEIIKWLIEGLMDIFRQVPGWIANALSSVADFITKPFREGVENIKRIMGEAKEALDKINPFHRESPSLIDWIEKGSDKMVGLYDGMFDKLNAITAKGRVGLVGATSTTANAAEQAGTRPIASSNTQINMNLSGLVARSNGELRDIGVQLIDAVNDELTSKGQQPLAT